MIIRLYPRELARDYVTIPAAGTGQQPFLLRDGPGRRHLYHANTAGKLILRRWDGADANPVDVTIDSNAGCSTPHFEQLQSWTLEGVYARDSVARLARSKDRGSHWTLATIPGTYTATTSVTSLGRRVLLGYRSSQWYVKVGELGSDGVTFSWCAEVSLGLTNPQGQGHLAARRDGALEFVYLDTDSVWQITVCRGLGKDGVGTWA